MTSMTAIHGRASSVSTTSERRKRFSTTVLNFAEGHVTRLRRTMRRTPVLVMRRAVYNARIDNALELGIDLGAHTGKTAAEISSPQPQRRPALKVVSS